ncbi:hypothetical protein ACFE04_028573 [Oxalis oulophora]
MQAQKEMPADMQCKDKFLLQSVKAPDGTTVKDITAEMFNKEAGHIVEEYKLRVIYMSPPQPPSPVPEGSEEGSSPRASVSDNGAANGSETAARGFADSQEKSSENPSVETELDPICLACFCIIFKRMLWYITLYLIILIMLNITMQLKALMAKLTEEKNNAIQLNNKLRQELDPLKRGGSKNNGGMSYMVVLIIGLIGIVLGYLMKKS